MQKKLKNKSPLCEDPVLGWMLEDIQPQMQKYDDAKEEEKTFNEREIKFYINKAVRVGTLMLGYYGKVQLVYSR